MAEIKTKIVGSELTVGDKKYDIKNIIPILHREFATKYLQELTGINTLIPNPTTVLAMVNAIRTGPKPNDCWKKTICYYNDTDKTIDIVQPFYFVPLVPETNPQYSYNAVKQDLPQDPLYLEPAARRINLNLPAENQQETEQTLEDLYKTADIDRLILAKQLIDEAKTRDQIAKTLADTFELSKAFAAEMLQKISFGLTSINPVILNGPQWGFFTYRIRLEDLTGFTVFDPISTKAISYLLAESTSTITGADIIHSFLSDALNFEATIREEALFFEPSISGSLLESRVRETIRNAEIFSDDLQQDQKAIYEGKDAASAKIQRPISQQIAGVKPLPQFIKSSAAWGTITPEFAQASDNYTYTITIRQGENAKITNISVSGSPPLISDRLETTETVDLPKKTVLVEQELSKAIDELISQPSKWEDKFNELYGLAQQEVGDDIALLSSLRTQLVASAENSKQALERDLFLHLAVIVRDGVMNNKFDIDGVPKDLISDELKKVSGKKKKVSIRNFDNIFGPYTLGKLPPAVAKKEKPRAINDYVSISKEGKNLVVKYTPEWEALLGQIKWISYQGTEAKLDYNLLQINRYSSETSQITKGLTQAELAYITALKPEVREKLRSATNYKDFFDNLYDNLIFYKKQPAKPVKLSSSGSPVKDGFEGLFVPPTEQEKQAIINELFNRKNQIVEQAFGGTGCLDTALKGAETIEELYNNVLHKGNWALFVARTIDRFRCELSKLGGGELACLANFEAVDTYQNALQAKDVIENFPDFLSRELELQPTSPILNLIYKREVPKLPSIDWYKCLRAFIIALILRVITDLITAFIQGILSLLDVRCGADFSSCEQSTIDPNSSVSGLSESGKQGLLVSGISANAEQAANSVNTFLRNKQIEEMITIDRLVAYIRFITGEMSVGAFKALLTGEPPQQVFSQAKYLTNNFFNPIDFTDDEFRAFISIIAENYDFEVFIGAVLFQRLLPDESCPPELAGGEDVLEEIKNALERRLQKEGSKTPSEDAQKKIDEAKEDLQNRVSAFCELLNTSSTAINSVISSASILAGFSNYALSRTIAGLITQLRVKPYYDYNMLQYLYTGAFFGKPDRDDIIRADLSLAYNVLYRTYDLKRVDDRSFRKNWNLTPNALKSSIGKNRWNTTIDILQNDSFEKEFLQDLLKVVVVVQPLLLPLYPSLEAAIFTNNASFLTEMEKSLLGASRDLNNSNYFYAWIENLISLIPMVDVRRFGTKYPNFVAENYPQQIGVDTANEKPFSLTLSRDADGLHYRYTNGTQTIMSLDLGLEDFTIQIGEEFSYTRSLPKLSEPFLVDDEFDYTTFVNDNNTIWSKKGVENPQEKIFLSLVEKSLKTSSVVINKPKENLAQLLFAESLKIVDDELLLAFENPDEKVANFFFQPYLKAQTIPEGVIKEGMSLEELKTQLKKIGNPKPPVELFFDRSDNLFSDVFFEDTLPAEVEKLIGKVESTMKEYYDRVASGKRYDPNKIANSLSVYRADSKIYYELERKTTSSSEPQFYLGSDLLSSPKMTKGQQEKVLAAAKEILGE